MIIVFYTEDGAQLAVRTDNIDALIEKKDPSLCPTILVLKSGTRFSIKESYRTAWMMWINALEVMKSEKEL